MRISDAVTDAPDMVEVLNSARLRSLSSATVKPGSAVSPSFTVGHLSGSARQSSSAERNFSRSSPSPLARFLKSWLHSMSPTIRCSTDTPECLDFFARLTAKSRLSLTSGEYFTEPFLYDESKINLLAR